MTDDRRKCSAHSSQTGRPCQNPPVKGGTVCRSHGGSAPAVKRKAAERLVEEQARAAAESYAANVVDLTDPIAAMMRVAGEIVGFKDFIAGRVAELRADEWRYDKATGEQLRAEIAVYERALDRASRVLVDINRLGLEERQVQLAERQGELLAGVIRRIIDSLDLTDEQHARAGVVAARELRAVSG